MATKKSKTSTKSTKAKSTKGGTAEKSVKKSEIEAPKTNTVEETKNASAKKSCFCGFFAKTVCNSCPYNRLSVLDSRCICHLWTWS